MTTLSIVTYPDKILKRKASPVKLYGADEIASTHEIKKLIVQMMNTMYKNQGIGLAAPQIGISKRIIVVETATNPRETAKEKSGKPLAFLNPIITKKSGKSIVEEEGCLSLPGMFVRVKRPENIELVCQTPEGKTVNISAGGLTARIFQHEIDHLNGKLIIDHLNLFKKLKLKKQLRATAQRK